MPKAWIPTQIPTGGPHFGQEEKIGSRSSPHQEAAQELENDSEALPQGDN